MRSIDIAVRRRRGPGTMGMLGVAMALLLPASPARSQEAAGLADLKPTLERLGNFAYAGDPIMVRVAIFNTSDKAFENTAGMDLIGNLAIISVDQDRRLPARREQGLDRRVEPGVIPPGGFFGRILDLREMVEGLDAPGRYRARLSLAGRDAQEIPFVVIPKYDPETAYRAMMETDYGTLTFDLLGKEAPKHVQNFFDLANQGYYDGTLIHAIVKGIEIHAGDRTGDGSSTPGYSISPEISPEARHRRGSLSMLRVGANDHGSIFVISLGETRERDGSFTIFGSLATGADVLTTLENVPTSGTRVEAPYRPLKPVRILSLRVEPAPAAAESPSS